MSVRMLQALGATVSSMSTNAATVPSRPISTYAATTPQAATVPARTGQPTSYQRLPVSSLLLMLSTVTPGDDCEEGRWTEGPGSKDHIAGTRVVRG